MTKNKSTKLMSLLLALVLITSCFVGGTLARYVTSTSSEDSARVAVWGINADDVEMDLFDGSYTVNGVLVADSEDGDNIIAPGTEKDNYFSIVNLDDNLKPEVMYEIAINLNDSEIDPLILNNPSIVWRLDEGEYGTWEETKAKILALSGDASGVKTYAPLEVAENFKAGVTHKIGWKWIMDNNNNVMDTEMGNKAATDGDISAKIIVKVTATQVNTDTTGMLDGSNQVFYSSAPTPLSFRSSADISDFNQLEINGEKVDDNNYTLTEGSTIVTLNIDYLKTLEAKTHSLSIVSETGTASTNFQVVTPTANSHGFYYNQPYSFENNALVISPNNTYKLVSLLEDGSPVIFNGTYTISGNEILSSHIDDEILTSVISSDGTEINCTTLGVTFVLDNVTFAADTDYLYTYNSNLDGYEVIAMDITKSSYAPIRTGINGKPTIALGLDAFYDSSDENPLTKMTVAPTLPNTITKIRDGAFGGCRFLREFTIPSTITEIGSSAFIGCKGLKEITIPSSITVLHNSVFQASGLEKIYLPNTLDKIEEDAFFGCNSLTEIIFDGTQEEWENIDIDDNAFRGLTNYTITFAN